VFILLDIHYVLLLQKSALVEEYSMQQSQNKYQQLNVFEEKFKQVNVLDQQLAKIQTGHLNWYNLFSELSNRTPAGIYINDLSTKDYSVFLVGKAKTRDNLLEFKNQLESSPCFQNVNVPLSDLVVKTDVVFQIDLKITENCLKNK
jgi:Tfp pilus assembly protein PilN